MPKQVFSPRQLHVYAGVALLLLLADPWPPTYALGCGLAGVGLALRTWGTGHLAKNQELTTSGPYAWVQHPLYLGTCLIAVGALLAAGAPRLPGLLVWVLGAPLSALVFWRSYLPRKRRTESERLRARFGAQYVAWEAAVPGFLPRGRAWPRDPGRRWSWRRYRHNHELEMALIVTGLFVALGLGGIP